MTGIENNPYYQGIGMCNGRECQVYYDYHQQVWSVQFSSMEWLDDVNPDDIELS